MSAPVLSISVVSHAQNALVATLLQSLTHQVKLPIEVCLTLNVAEPLGFDPQALGYPIDLIQNPQPLGFGANHNQAFRRARGAYFCVINPDIVLTQDPFTVLLHSLAQTTIGVAAPQVRAPNGQLEDSVRRFPSPLRILQKALRKPTQPDYHLEAETQSVDWVGGMCMVFRRAVFAEIGGFDESYFLYYEDVDLCARLWARGYQVVVCRDAQVVHDARRHSHRNLRYMRWHLSSMLRFFITHAWRRWRSGQRRP